MTTDSGSMKSSGFWSGLFSKGIRIEDLPFETDMHSHVLPGVDDGFRDMEHSCRAVAELAALGVKNMVLTPHIYPELYPNNTHGFISRHFDAVKGRLEEASGINFLIAGEHMVYEGIEETFNGDLLLLPGRHILIEMSYAYESSNIDETIFRLNCLDYHPVLAHPERYIFYSGDTGRMKDIVDRGCSLQLNLLSLGGFYGKGAAMKAAAILEKGLYSYVGTDLHSLAQIEMLRSMRFRKRHIPQLERIMMNTTSLLSAS